MITIDELCSSARAEQHVNQLWEEGAGAVTLITFSPSITCFKLFHRFVLYLHWMQLCSFSLVHYNQSKVSIKCEVTPGSDTCWSWSSLVSLNQRISVSLKGSGSVAKHLCSLQSNDLGPLEGTLASVTEESSSPLIKDSWIPLIKISSPLIKGSSAKSSEN